jgi:hypothetical protein
MADIKKTEKVKEKTTAKVSVKPKIRFEDKIDEQIKVKVVEIPKISNVYSADFSIIDNTIEEIKKQSRKVGTSYYACNNIYILLEDALKKIILAYK